MDQIPTQLAENTGKEVPFGQILLAVWRRLRTTWGKAIYIGFLLECYIFLVEIIAIVAFFLVCGAVNLILRYLFHHATLDISGKSVLAVLPPVVAISTYLFGNGYLWASICSFSRSKMDWTDAKKAWHSPARGALLKLGLIMALFSIVFLVPGLIVTEFDGKLPSFSGSAALGAWADWTGSTAGGVVKLLTEGVITVCTLLAGVILIQSPQPRIGMALAENLRILRRRPVLFLALAVAPVALEAVLTPLGRGVQNELWFLIESFICLVANGLFYVCYVFVLAVFFRAERSLPFEQPYEVEVPKEPAGVELPADSQL